MKVHITAFKPTGKYYTDEDVEIPDSTPFWDYSSAIRTALSGRLSSMFLTGIYPNEVPFLIPPLTPTEAPL